MLRWLRRLFSSSQREGPPEPEWGNPGEDEWDFYGNPWIRINYSDEYEAYRRSCEPYPEAAVQLHAVLCYRDRTLNGGHAGFFEASGVAWVDAIAGLERLGCAEAAATLGEAAERLGVARTASSKEHLDALDHHPDSEDLFEDLDARFWPLNDAIGAAMRREFTAHPLHP